MSAVSRVSKTPPGVCRREPVCRKIFGGAKTGSVERNAIKPERNRTIKAYEVLVGTFRMVLGGLDLIDL